MNRLLTFPLRLIVFWLLFFALFRLWFILWFTSEWSNTDPGSVWRSFWYALPLDLSMAAYLVTLPVLAWFLGWGLGTAGKNRCSRFIHGFNTFFFSGLVFLFGANIFLYEEWHTLINNRALEYFKDPAALLDSMSLVFKLVSVLLYIGFVWLVAKGYQRVVGKALYPAHTPRIGLAAFPAWLCVLPLAIRGGLGVMPINESAVYYSAHLFDNHAATNAAWHLVHSMIETRSTKNHYALLEPQEAQSIVAGLRQTVAVQDTINLPCFWRPDSSSINLVMVVMESMTAQIMSELGGVSDVCPTLSRLSREGILFTNCYSSGYRTDQGIVSVLAGYPAQPDQSIVLLEDKASKLQSIARILKQRNYATAFFYGGELTFANIGAWLSQQRFEKIFSERDFNSAEKTQRWGVDDRILLQRAITEINRLPEPFFATAMTLSLHPPYDVPYTSRWKGQDQREQFLNSAAFADAAINDFLKQAEKMPWFSRTVFVFVADHGASLPSGAGADNPLARHVPWIVWGRPLLEQWKGKRLDPYCNHHDIPATLLNMLGIQTEPEAFPWSRNWWRTEVLNAVGRPAPDGFAYFSNENGLGWVNASGKAVYYFEKKAWHPWSGSLTDTEKLNAIAYLQVLYDDFLEK